MRNLQVRGICLATVLLLLVTAGVALAQPRASIDRECFQCVPEGVDPGDVPYDPYKYTITSSGWEPLEAVSQSWHWANGDTWGGG